MADLLQEALAWFPETQALRRDLHQHPELGYREVRTAGVVVRELRALGLEPRTGIAETGVTAWVEGGEPGPRRLLRFDMDALPVEEQTGAAYASCEPGRMHACGHDGHVAIGLTVARLLQRHRAELAGSVLLVFQPAEEGLNGAERMLAEGALQNLAFDAALAVHLWNDFPVGKLLISAGPFMAGSAVFRIVLQGRGGHGASPHQTADPVLAAAQLITTLQGVVARNVAPLEAAVLSVCSVRAGEAFNVIPDQAELRGTLRWFSPQVGETLRRRLHQVTEGVGAAMGCGVTIELQDLTPPVINDPATVEQVRRVARQLLPQAEIVPEYCTMGSEDFAYFLQVVPGCMVFVGSANAERGLNAPHHHPRFDFDEAALPQAAALMAGWALGLGAQ